MSDPDSTLPRIFCAGPSITQREIDYAADAAANAWYETAGEYHNRLNAAVADYLDVRHVIATPTGTSALHLALWSLGIGPGDEVIVPELTWIGTSAPASYLGATPVFADVDPGHLCLSAETIEPLITPNTRAVVVVHLHGDMPDMAAIGDLCSRHGVAVVEDAAQAFGSRWKGRHAGTHGDVGIYSLHGAKTLTAGEGGLLVTNRDDLMERAMTLRDHGRQTGNSRFYEGFDRSYYHFEIGNKFKMSAMQAAVALAQVERAEELVGLKRRIQSWYEELLPESCPLHLQVERPGVFNSFSLPAVLINTAADFDKQSVIAHCDKHNIDIRPFFYPLSLMPPYRDTPQGRRAREANKVAYSTSPLGFNLPSGLRMTREDAQRVVDVLAEFCLATATSH